jgi:hypothetical protein
MQRVVALIKNQITMKKTLLSFFIFGSINLFGQQLTNANMELWTTESYGAEPNNWQYNDGTGLVYGTNNIIRSYDGNDPLTTTKISGTAAFGGSGNSVLLETKTAIGSTMTSNGLTTIPGYLYRQEAISNPNIGSLTFKYKPSVVSGDSCFVKVGLIDASFNIYSLGVFWIKPSDNSTTWKTKTIILENQLPGTPTEIFIEATSTFDGFDGNYSYTTPIIGSKLYLDNFTLNYCNTPITTNLTETICDYMLPYTWNGLTFNSSGSQSVTLTSSLGCDSIVNMTLNVIPGPYTLIPDVGFETFLGSIGLDPCGIDGKVPTSYIDTVVSLSINGNGLTPAINNLTGIEGFASLETLNINRQTWQTTSGVYITSSDGFNLTQNINLKKLICKGCNLQNLNLSANVNLESLDLSPWSNPTLPLNNISSLNLTSNTLLKSVNISYCGTQSLSLPVSFSLLNLSASNNSLTDIDISNLSGLKRINLSNNNLSQLIGNNNSTLKALNVSGNSQLTNLPSSCVNLDTLNVEGCAFSGLQLSNQTTLNWLNCKSNQLQCLSLKNNANNQIVYINTLNNFNLTCIEVDDSTYSTNNPVWNANKDTWSSYSENCQVICSTAEIVELNSEFVNLYPNPTNGLISFESNNEIQYIEITSIDGRTSTSFNSKDKIDISNFDSGIYNLTFNFSTGSKYTKRIIKN